MSNSQEDILNIFKRPFDATEKTGTTVEPEEGAIIPSNEPLPGVPFSGGGYCGEVQPTEKDKHVRVGEPFSIFIDSHRSEAKELIDYFMKATTESKLNELAQEKSPNLNAELLIYALSFVMIRKPELFNTPIPTMVEVFPQKFVETTNLVNATKKARMPSEEGEWVEHVDEELTGTFLKPEHRLAYWREDYGISCHHHHWHLVYAGNFTPEERDRKGELFYYMHKQMLARYDMERLSVGLNRVAPLNDLRAPIQEGYFPKLFVDNSGVPYASRQDFTPLKDVRRDDVTVEISEIETWCGRLLDAIQLGYMQDTEGNKIYLSDDVQDGLRGIDILGNAIEADRNFSPNYDFYGNIHNAGHNLISFVHDPENHHKEPAGVMSSAMTAMRDPVFYRWHKFIDSLFKKYKLTQRPYTRQDLKLKNVHVDSVEVQHEDKAMNTLHTRMGNKMFNGSGGLIVEQPTSSMKVFFNFRRLVHDPFNYTIQVTNYQSEPKDVTVRIFLAPKRDERRREMKYSKQRDLWAEMDKFTHKLQPGTNTIIRDSTESSVTCPEPMTFEDCRVENTTATRDPYCNCGWPQHLLLPKGTPKGMDFHLFVMLTDWDKDKVEPPSGCKTCKNAASFCGILNAKYPDRRSMGFPFDRVISNLEEDKTTISELADQYDNIMLTDIKIIFDEIQNY